jgi:hypothetical protein
VDFIFVAFAAGAHWSLFLLSARGEDPFAG